jgi:cell division protein FtsW (lipid II flippase)
MANTKGKIIIAGGIIVIAGVTTAILVSHYRKKRILNEIYRAINDTKTEQGQQALLNEENQLF